MISYFFRDCKNKFKKVTEIYIFSAFRAGKCPNSGLFYKKFPKLSKNIKKSLAIWEILVYNLHYKVTKGKKRRI